MASCSSKTLASTCRSCACWPGHSDRSPIDLFAFCLMPNHWHLLLRRRSERRPESASCMADEDSTRSELRRWRGNRGGGAVYQGRYRASPVAHETYFYRGRAIRRTKSGPSQARRSVRTDWMWSSASPNRHASRGSGSRRMAAPAARRRGRLRQRHRAAATTCDFIRRRVRGAASPSPTRSADVGSLRLPAEPDTAAVSDED